MTESHAESSDQGSTGPAAPADGHAPASGAAPAPLTPPDDAAPLLLEAPEPVAPVEPVQATGFLPVVAPERRAQIESQAAQFVRGLDGLNVHAPEFSQKIGQIQALARTEIARSGLGTSRILQERSTSPAGARASGSQATVQVTKALADLRSTVEELTPRDADLSGFEKLVARLPFGRSIRRYFHRFETAQVQLDGIVKSLTAGQDELRKDNASLQQEKRELWATMLKLDEYAYLAQVLDQRVAELAGRARAEGRDEDAGAIESDLLFEVRQRHQDILTQLAVCVQGYMAMDLVRKNNEELVKGVDRAKSTTVFALKTAVIVSQALDTQKLVLDQIDAVNEVTNRTIEQTSELLKQQTGRVHEQAASSGVSVASLQRAFDNVFATLDAIDAFKQQANQSMAQTIGALQTQLDAAKPRLERIRAQEDRDGGSGPAR